MGHDQSDSKSQLVTEICSISKLSVACSHMHCTTTTSIRSSSPFVDWYPLLGVEETARIDVIRKRYHELALQLHPDKNKHAKAEVAFKLVSGDSNLRQREVSELLVLENRASYLEL